MAVRVLTHIMEMLFSLVRSLCGSRADLAMEVLALRQPFDSAALRSGQSTGGLQAQESEAAPRLLRPAVLVGPEGPGGYVAGRITGSWRRPALRREEASLALRSRSIQPVETALKSLS